MRFYDIMCKDHVEEVLEEWLWPTGGYHPGNDSCCNACATFAREYPGAATIYPMGQMNASKNRMMASWHEAAHAIVGVRVGITPHYISLTPDQGIEDSAGHASVTFSEPRDPFAESVMVWAGLLGTRACLENAGLRNDDSAIVGGAYLSRSDGMLIRDWLPTPSARRSARVEGTVIIRESWSEIGRLAAKLTLDGRVDRDEILNIAAVRTNA